MEKAKASILSSVHRFSEARIPVLPAVDGGRVDSERFCGFLYGEAAGDQIGEGFAYGGAPLGRAAGFPLLHRMDIPGQEGFAKAVTPTWVFRHPSFEMGYRQEVTPEYGSHVRVLLGSLRAYPAPTAAPAAADGVENLFAIVVDGA